MNPVSRIILYNNILMKKKNECLTLEKNYLILTVKIAKQIGDKSESKQRNKLQQDREMNTGILIDYFL